MGDMSTLERVGFVLEKYQDGGATFVDLLKRVKTALESSELARVPATTIQPFAGQPREYFNPVKIKNLSDSIDVTAQIQAGMVRRMPGVSQTASVLYELIDGERRWRAILLIPEERRPFYKCEILDADDEVVQFLIAGMANFNREGHQPLEVADTIQRYCDFGIPMEAVADLLGFSAQWAYNIRSLRNLSDPVRDLLRPRESDDEEEGKKVSKRPLLPVVAAILIAKVSDPGLQLALANEVIQGKVSLAQLRKRVIETARIAGTPIKVPTVNPRKLWDRRHHKVRALMRHAEALSELMDDERVQQVVSANQDERSRFRRDLKRIRVLIEGTEKKVGRLTDQ